MNKTKKHTKAAFFAAVLISAVMLTGCMGRRNNNILSPSPTAGTNGQGIMTERTDEPNLPMIPDSLPTELPSSGNGIQTLEESKKASEEMEDAIVLLTEVDNAYVTAWGNEALIGISFDSQYQGELDERIKKMIYARVQTVSKDTTRLHITTDENLRNSVEDLSSQLEQAESVSEIESRFRKLCSEIPVYTE